MRQTPREEGWRVSTYADGAGASAFLRKSEGVRALTETVARLLARRPRHC